MAMSETTNNVMNTKRVAAVAGIVQRRGAIAGYLPYEIELGARCALALYEQNPRSAHRAIRGGLERARKLAGIRQTTQPDWQHKARQIAICQIETLLPIYECAYPADGRVRALVFQAQGYVCGLIDDVGLREARGIAERVYAQASHLAAAASGQPQHSARTRAASVAEALVYTFDPIIDLAAVRGSLEELSHE